MYINNTMTDKELIESIPFIVVTKNFKYLGMNLIKDVNVIYNEIYKTSRKEIEDTKMGKSSLSMVCKN